jgi:hypothetical protein
MNLASNSIHVTVLGFCAINAVIVDFALVIMMASYQTTA